MMTRAGFVLGAVLLAPGVAPVAVRVALRFRGAAVVADGGPALRFLMLPVRVGAILRGALLMARRVGVRASG